jgi:hypothetical protein
LLSALMDLIGRTKSERVLISMKSDGC